MYTGVTGCQTALANAPAFAETNIAAGVTSMRIYGTFPLDWIAEANRYLKAGRATAGSSGRV